MVYQAKKRYHRIDGWRGYMVPACAVVGSSDTGGWEDSPCRPEDAQAELRRFRKDVLKPLGITARQRYGTSSNVFCMKRWLVVKPEDFDKAAAATVEHMKEHDREYRLLHDADLEQCSVAAA